MKKAYFNEVPARCVLLCVALGAASLQSVKAQEDGSANLARNPGFEEEVIEPGTIPGWVAFTTRDGLVAVVATEAKSGSQSVRITTQHARGEIQGFFQTLPISAGIAYSFSISVMKDKSDPLGSSAHVVPLIEYKDAAGQHLWDVEGKPLDSSLSGVRWETASVDCVTAPMGAVEANFCIHLREGKMKGKGSVFLDDALITRVVHAAK